jgi:predicted Zn-dependent peptidase
MSKREQLAEGVERVVWPNGMRLVAETVPGARTAAIGLWVEAGSRHEPGGHQGITHLIEHMFFKGTATNSAQALALAMNALGGHFNAFTTQETVCLHARVIDAHLAPALDLLVEMYRESVFDAEELERERSVILEEIKMTNDTPDELIHDLFHAELWGDHGLGRSILGTEETIRGLARGDLTDHRRREFTPPRLIVSAAGALDVDALAHQVERLLGGATRDDPPREHDKAPRARFERRHVERRLEQTHFCLGTLAPRRSSDDRHAFALVSAVLGGGASSRIFQEIREKRGLAYSIGTFAAPYSDVGCFGIAGGTSPENLPEVFERSLAEVHRICREPLPEDELRNAKDQMRVHLLLGLESMDHRMSRLADLEIHFDRHIPLDETLAKIEALTAEDLLAAAQTHLRNAPLAAVTIGPGLTPAERLPASL